MDCDSAFFVFVGLAAACDCNVSRVGDRRYLTSWSFDSGVTVSADTFAVAAERRPCASASDGGRSSIRCIECSSAHPRRLSERNSWHLVARAGGDRWVKDNSCISGVQCGTASFACIGITSPEVPTAGTSPLIQSCATPIPADPSAFQQPAPQAERVFIVCRSGQETLDRDAGHVLEGYRAACGGKASLPSRPVSDLSGLTAVLNAAIQMSCPDCVNSAAALQTCPRIANTLIYSLLVLLQAKGKSKGIQQVFSWRKPTLSRTPCLSSWKSTCRHWWVDTSDVVEGKSPGMKTLVNLLIEVLHTNAKKAVGFAGDWPCNQQSGTTEGVQDKLWSSNEYLVIYCRGETRYLRPTIVTGGTGGTAEPYKYIEMEVFLDAARDDEVSHATQLPRDNPEDRFRHYDCDRGIYDGQEETNVQRGCRFCRGSAKSIPVSLDQRQWSRKKHKMCIQNVDSSMLAELTCSKLFCASDKRFDAHASHHGSVTDARRILSTCEVMLIVAGRHACAISISAPLSRNRHGTFFLLQNTSSRMSVTAAPYQTRKEIPSRVRSCSWLQGSTLGRYRSPIHSHEMAIVCVFSRKTLQLACQLP